MTMGIDSGGPEWPLDALVGLLRAFFQDFGENTPSESPSFIQGGKSTPLARADGSHGIANDVLGCIPAIGLIQGGTHLRDAKILTFRAGFEIVDFGPKTRPETAGKLQSVRRKNVPISAF